MRILKHAVKSCVQGWRSILIVILLLIICQMYFEIQQKKYIIIAKDREKRQVLESLQGVAKGMRNSERMSQRDRDKKLLQYESSSILVGGERNLISKRRPDVCPEEYKGNQFWPYQFEAWQLQNCTYGEKVEHLVTIFFGFTSTWKRTVDSIHKIHPYIKIISDCANDQKVPGVECIGINPTVSTFQAKVKTKHFLYAPELDYFNEWADLYRAVRVMSDSELGIFGVSGASRNLTGHWATGCLQIKMEYYRLQILEGYTEEYSDCMVCDYTQGPVLIRTDQLINSEIEDPDLFLLDSAIRKKGLWLVCPDLLFFTRNSIGKFDIRRDKLKELAKLHKFQGLVTERTYNYKMDFSCEDIGVKCDIRSQAAEYLVPWCCVQSFRHILQSLEHLRSKYGTHYELESGSLLGAVKLGNFIPWDIDMDLAFRRSDFDLFRLGGPAANYLQDAGMVLYRYSEDMYHVKGAGMFFMDYGGITAEMLGEKSNLTLKFLPAHLEGFPTLAQVAPDLWAPVIINPGRYARGRYGPGYLYHVQSWRHAGLQSSYDRYSPVAWQPCSDPENQACLTNYPIIGNMEVLPNMYP